MKFDTLTVHAVHKPNIKTGAIVPSLVTAKNGAFRSLSEPIMIKYGRGQNPTRKMLEDIICQLESGEKAFAFSSGLAAIHATFNVLETGDHVIISDKIYGGTMRLADHILSKFLQIEYADFTDPKNIQKAIKHNTKLFFIETPTNPLLEIIDLEQISSLARQTGCLLVVDNTLATPYALNPIKYGADIVIHSTSKYVSGHSDVIGGIIVCSSRVPKVIEKINFLSRTIGSMQSPRDAYELIKGIKTLSLRVEKQSATAEKIANYLNAHEYIKKVYYPGLPTHNGHNTAKRQMKAFGGVLSFEIKGDEEVFADAIGESCVDENKFIYLAESLGSVETLITHPASMTHSYLSDHLMKKANITTKLFRLSVGIENIDDIIFVLNNALHRSMGK